jgi:hypothetical protein
MGITFIFIGSFLWFALMFNGGVGEGLVNLSFFVSGLFMIITGISIRHTNIKNALIFCSIALLCYIPMIWQRFDCCYGTDWGGLCFDIIFIALMLAFILKNLTSSSSGTPQSGAP